MARLLIGLGVLAVAVIVLGLVFLTSGSDGDIPTQEVLDTPAASVVTGSDGAVRIVVDTDFEGSVDNIALYGDGALVDQRGSLGGSLVWEDPPEGTHELVLRAQKADVIVIGEPAEITIGSSSTDSGDDSAAAETSTTTTAAATTVPTTVAPTTTEPPIGPFVSVIASVAKTSVSREDAETSGRQLATDLGLDSHRVIDSDGWASIRDGFWVIVTASDHPTLAAAARECWNLGARDASVCFGRPISQNPDDLTVVGVPAP